MCKYCERRKDVKCGWEQPKLPYHNNCPDVSQNISGNMTTIETTNAVIHDYQTTTPELIITDTSFFGGEGIGTLYIPIYFCPMCGRKLGKTDTPKD